MAYTNRIFTWDFDALKRFYEKYIVKWINSAVSWTEAQKKQARANLGFGDGDIDSEPTADSDRLVKSGGVKSELDLLHNEIGDNVDYSNYKIIGGGYIRDGGGSISSNSTTSDLIKFLPVFEGKTYKYEGNSGNITAVYGYATAEFSNPVELVDKTSDETKSVEFEIPTGVHYICAWSRNSAHKTTPSELKLLLVNPDGIKQKANVRATLLEEEINGSVGHSTSLSYGRSRTALDGSISHGEKFKIKINSIGCAIEKVVFSIYNTSDTTSGNYKFISFRLTGSSAEFVLENSSSSEYVILSSTDSNFTATHIRVVQKVDATLDDGETWSVDATIESDFNDGLKQGIKDLEEQHDGLKQRIEHLEEQPPFDSIPCYNGYSIPKNPSKLRILSVGNSFIGYPMRALNNWLSQLGITTVEWGMVIKGGYSLQQYSDDVDGGEGAYDFIFMNADNDYDITNYVNAGTGESSTHLGYESNLRDCILFKDWDIISFQQASTYSGKYDSVNPYLNKLIAYSRYYCKNSGVKIVWQQTWSAASDCTEKLVYYNNSQQEMLDGIVDVSKKVEEYSGLDLIIPSGIVVENLRNVPNEFWSDPNITGDEFMDSTKYHPNNMAIYAICGAWVQMLVLNAYGGTIRGCQATYTGVSGNDAAMAKQCILKAIGNRYAKSSIDTTNIE